MRSGALLSAGLFHGMHDIARQIAPVVSSGLEVIEAEEFRLHCFQSPTGIKIFVTAESSAPDLMPTLRAIYRLYADFALKVRTPPPPRWRWAGGVVGRVYAPVALRLRVLVPPT